MRPRERPPARAWSRSWRVPWRVPLLYLIRVRPAGLTALVGLAATATALTYAGIAGQQWGWGVRAWWPVVQVCCAAGVAWLAAMVTDRRGRRGLRMALLCVITVAGVAAWMLSTWVFP